MNTASGDIKVETCPQCGAPAELRARRCGYCEAEFIVASLAALDHFDKSGIQKYVSHFRGKLVEEPENAELHFALGVCQLDLGLHEHAVKSFARGIGILPEHADGYYYLALAVIHRRKPKLLTFEEVRAIQRYLSAAIQLDDSKANYHCLLLVVKYEFYLKNGLSVPPPGIAEIQRDIASREYDAGEIERMLKHVHVQDEEILQALRRG